MLFLFCSIKNGPSCCGYSEHCLWSMGPACSNYLRYIPILKGKLFAIRWKEKYDAEVVDCHHTLHLCDDRMMSLPKNILF